MPGTADRQLARLRAWREGRNPVRIFSPGIVALAGGVVLVALEGGYPLTVWYPAALFLLALVVVAAVASPPQTSELSRAQVAGLALFALFCAWNYLSMLWADAPGEAWHAANRALLYGLVLLATMLRPWTRGEALLGLAVVVAGLTAVALWLLLAAGSTSDPGEFFVEGRLSQPTDYSNATAAALLIGFWPAVFLASTPLIPWFARGLSLGAATVLLQTAVLAQSRGALIAFVATGILYIALTPRRWPALLVLGALLGLTAVSFDTLVEVREVRERAGFAPVLDDAVRAVLLGALVATVAGAVAGLVGGRLPGAVRSRRARGVGDLAVVGLGVAALVAVLITIGNPGDWIEARWDDFKNSDYTQVESGRTRFGGSLGSGRYDFYRVSYNSFRREPIAGLGADNFAADYLVERRTSEAPRYPHSLAFMVLGQLGVVGVVLLVAALIALFAAVGAAARRAASRAEAAIVVGALAGFLAFFIHALADWLWEVPALGTLAFGLLGLATQLRSSPEEGLAAEVEPRRKPRVAWNAGSYRVPLALLVLVVAISLSLPGIAARYTSSAYDGFQDDLDGALERLDRAAELNPLSAEPLIATGVIAQRAGRDRLALEALRDAVEREPGNWFAHLELAMAEQRAGLDRSARRSSDRALRLNPRQPVVRQVRRRIRRGRTVDAARVERELYGQLQSRLGPTAD